MVHWSIFGSPPVKRTVSKARIHTSYNAQPQRFPATSIASNCTVLRRRQLLRPCASVREMLTRPAVLVMLSNTRDARPAFIDQQSQCAAACKSLLCCPNVSCWQCMCAASIRHQSCLRRLQIRRIFCFARSQPAVFWLVYCIHLLVVLPSVMHSCLTSSACIRISAERRLELGALKRNHGTLLVSFTTNWQLQCCCSLLHALRAIPLHFVNWSSPH